MKKILAGIATFFLAVLLVACNNKVENVVISKVYGATDLDNNVIELYNNSNKDVSLSGYSLRFYTNGSKEVSHTISLTGKIGANDFFTISGKAFNISEYKEKIDFTYTEDRLPFNGNDAIELAYKKKGVDVVGFIGMDINFSNKLTLIRLGEKKDYKPTTTYETESFINYVPDLFKYLKNDNHEIKTVEQLLAGPRLEDRYFDMPFKDPNQENAGGGGVIAARWTFIADGDTASFTGEGYPGGSMRYFYINTPEVNGTYVSAEPWGYVASKYNKEYLLTESNRDKVLLQSIPGYTLTETHGRNIGLIWVNGHLSQFLIVAEGLSEDVSILYNDYDLLLSYKEVPYLTFLLFAEQNAIDNGWGTKGYPKNPNGEKSPDWNYQSGSLATTNPNWKPHLPLPWNN